MIRYALTCADGHAFEAWFGSAETYDRLRTAGRVACPDCGSTEVEKALMAPQVSKRRRGAAALARRIAELKAEVEATSTYVGSDFAAEARAIHQGEKPHRTIHGEAKPAEARRLVADGVPIAPLPFLPKRQLN